MHSVYSYCVLSILMFQSNFPILNLQHCVQFDLCEKLNTRPSSAEEYVLLFNQCDFELVFN